MLYFDVFYYFSQLLFDLMFVGVTVFVFYLCVSIVSQLHSNCLQWFVSLVNSHVPNHIMHPYCQLQPATAYSQWGRINLLRTLRHMCPTLLGCCY